MISLIKKELMARWPYLLIALLVGLDQVLGVLVGDSILNDLSTQPLQVLSSYFALGGLICFASAHGAIIQEFRDGHIEFINGLPVRRWKLYCAKVFISLAVVAILVVMASLALLLAVWVSKDASHGSTLTVVASVLGLYLAGLLGFCGAGLLFSWLGGVGWGLLLCAIVALVIPGAVDVRLRPLGLESYMDFEFMGKNAVIYGWAAYVWLGSFVVCVLVSWFAFSGPGEVLIRVSSGLMASSRRVLTVVVGGVLVLVGVATIRPAKLIDALLVDSRVMHTEHFRVLYRTEEAQEAEELIAKIDDIDRKVRGIFGVSEVAQVVMEFTGGGRFHDGRYTGGKISLKLGEASVSIVAHELAHAYADRLAGEFSGAHHGTWRFFNEGLATWVGWKVSGQADTRVAKHRWAGAIFARGQHEFDLLLQDKQRSRLYDSDEVYPLGLVFVDALVEVQGQDSPACILRAFGQLGADSVTGKAAWYAACKKCGFNLDGIVARYEAMLAGHQTMTKPTALASVSTVMFEGQVYLSVQEAPGAIRPKSCRVRKSLATSRPESRVGGVGLNGLCFVAAHARGPLVFYYQMGTEVAEGVVEYGPWAKAWVPSPDQDCQTPACLSGVCDSISCNGDVPVALWPPAGDGVHGTEVEARTQVQLVSYRALDLVEYGPRGKYLVAASGKDSAVSLLDATGLRVLRVFKGHDRPVTDFDIAPDGSSVVGVAANQVIAWRIPSGEILWQRSSTGVMGGVGFASRRQFLVVGRNWGGRRLLDILHAQDGKHLATISASDDYQPDIRSVDVVGNDERVIVADFRSVSAVELETGVEVWAIKLEGLSRVAACKAGAQVAVGARNGHVASYDALTGHRRWFKELGGAGVNKLVYSSDCAQLLLQQGYKKLTTFDTSNGTHQAKEASHRLIPLAFSPDGASVIGAGARGGIFSWPELELQVKQPAFSTGITSLGVSPRGDYVVTSYPPQIFDTPTGTPITFHRDSGIGYGLAFSADGRRIVSAGYGGAVNLLSKEKDWRMRKVVGEFRGEPTLKHSLFLPGGDRVVLGDAEGQITLLDLTAGTGPRYLLHSSRVVGLGITADDQGVSAARDGDIVFWDLESGGELKRFQAEAMYHARVSPDGKLIAGALISGHVVVWRMDDFAVVARFSCEHGGPEVVAFSPDGRKVAVGMEHGYVRVFDIETKERGLGLQAHSGEVTALEFLPGGGGFITAGKDNTWARWNYPAGDIRYRVVSDRDGEWVRWDSVGVPTASKGAQKYLHRVRGGETEIPTQSP